MPQTSETAPQPSELPMRLTRLRVKNFRSIAELDIPLSPLTVLVGPNGSGKSNVVDALRFVRDVFARGLDQAVMDREGMGVIQRWGTEAEEIEFGVTFYSQAGVEKYASTDENGNTTEHEFSWPSCSIGYDFSLEHNSEGLASVASQRLIVNQHGECPFVIEIERKGIEVQGRINYQAWQTGLEKRNFLADDKNYLISPSGLFGYVGYETEEEPYEEGFPALSADFSQWHDGGGIAIKAEKRLYRPLFYNLNPNNLREPQRSLKEYPFDEKGRNLAATLRHILRQEQNWTSLLFSLSRAVAGFDSMEIESVGGYLATKLLYHTDDPAKPRASYLGQESDGTIRMLGLLAALYQEPAQPFISIEEPEANIHPGALAVLAGVLDEASLRSQVLVTTHSPDMLDHLPAESFLVVEKVGDATRVGPLDAAQLESVRKRLFTPGELLRMEGLQRQADNDSRA